MNFSFESLAALSFLAVFAVGLFLARWNITHNKFRLLLCSTNINWFSYAISLLLLALTFGNVFEEGWISVCVLWLALPALLRWVTEPAQKEPKEKVRGLS